MWGGRETFRSERGWNSEKSINENCLFQISLFLVSFVLMSHTSWNNINDMRRMATGLLIAVCNKFELGSSGDVQAVRFEVAEFCLIGRDLGRQSEWNFGKLNLNSHKGAFGDEKRLIGEKPSFLDW